MSLKIESEAFTDQSEIPSRFTCEGENQSPPLHWQEVPKEASSLVLIVDDPDAPDPKAPKRTWVHWVLYNIPPGVSSLPEGVQSKDLPSGTAEGLNDWGRTGYGGPCPPIGRHRYFHKLYALDVILKNLKTPRKSDLESAMEGHILSQATIMGTYQKKK